MRTTSLASVALHSSANERSLVSCQNALELKDQDDYEGVRQVMRNLWMQVGERPDIEGLHPPVAAEVLLCAGIMTGWLGSKNQTPEAQEAAKNLITESITSYESVGDRKNVAVARAELAYCYWREGALDEARIMFKDALEKLTIEGNTRARAILRLAILEWSASRFSDAFDILTSNAPLFKKITNQAIKGAYHSQFAMVLRKLATPENRREFLQRAVAEYEEADQHFRLARNVGCRADVKNNVGNLLRQLSRFKEAHRYIDEARRLSVSIKDKVRTAQFDDTRAQVLIAQSKLKEAERAAAGAVAILKKSDQSGLLTDALITHGIVLARLKKSDRAQFSFQNAIDVGIEVGALNKAGLAALTMLEEIPQLPAEVSWVAYQNADEWLEKSQGQEILTRLSKAARKVFACLSDREKEQPNTDVLFNKAFDLQKEVLKYEGALISRALANVSGSVTHAAGLLGMSYQGLAYIIESRHRNLLKERTPVRRRGRKE